MGCRPSSLQSLKFVDVLDKPWQCGKWHASACRSLCRPPWSKAFGKHRVLIASNAGIQAKIMMETSSVLESVFRRREVGTIGTIQVLSIFPCHSHCTLSWWTIFRGTTRDGYRNGGNLTGKRMIHVVKLQGRIKDRPSGVESSICVFGRLSNAGPVVAGIGRNPCKAVTRSDTRRRWSRCLGWSRVTAALGGPRSGGPVAHTHGFRVLTFPKRQ